MIGNFSLYQTRVPVQELQPFLFARANTDVQRSGYVRSVLPSSHKRSGLQQESLHDS
jgi:hypothetical protein